MIDEVLKWSYGTDDLGERSPKRVVDVGCGIGGSSRHIVRKYAGSTAQGITLSPYQANRGNEVSEIGFVNICVSEPDSRTQPFASFSLLTQ